MLMLRFIRFIWIYYKENLFLEFNFILYFVEFEFMLLWMSEWMKVFFFVWMNLIGVI